MTFPWLLIVNIAVGLAAVFIVYHIYKKRKESVNFLKDDYKKAYMDLVSRIGASSLSIKEQKDVSVDIAAMLYDAQNSNKPVSSVTSENTTGFIESIVSSLGLKNQWPFLIAEGIQYMLFSVFIVQLAVYLIRPTSTLYTATIGYSLVLYLFILSFIIVPSIKCYIKKKNLFALLVPIILVIMYFSLFILNNRLFTSSSVMGRIFDGEISLIPNAVIFVIYILIFLLTFVFRHLYRKAITNKMVKS